jgi:hypothetical protein
MNQGSVEIEGHTQLWVPMNVSLAVAPLDGLETRVGYGVVGSDDPNGAVRGWELSLTRRILKTDEWFSSASVAYEKFHSDEWRLDGTRITSSLAVGLYYSDWFGIYLPLKVGWLDVGRADAYEVVPGFGLTFERYGLVFRIAGNFAIPSRVGRFENVPYVGMQIGLRPASIIEHILK